MKKFKTFIANNRDRFIALLFSTTLLFLLSFKIDIVNLNLTNFQCAGLITIIILVLILLWKKIMKKFKTFIANNRDGFIALLFSTTLLFLLSFKIDIVNLNLTNFQCAGLITIIILVLILLWKKIKYFRNNFSVL